MFQKIINSEEAPGRKPLQVPKPSLSASSPEVDESAETYESPITESTPPSAHSNFVGPDVQIKGSIHFEDTLIIDGNVDGEISSTGTLYIQPNARITAEVKVGTTVIEGRVHGNITATDSIELRANAEVVGDIKAAVLSIHPGAVFIGKSEVGKASAAPKATPAPSDNKAKSNQTPSKKQNSGSSNKPSNPSLAKAS